MALGKNNCAHGETFFVEAPTQIRMEVHGEAGGTIELILTDELNHGIGSADIEITLTRTEDHAQKRMTIKTDRHGHVKSPLKLPPGRWHGTVAYSGHDGLLMSEKQLTVNSTLCDAGAALLPADGGIFQTGDDIRIEIRRKDGICANFPARWIVSLADRSINIEMKPGQTQEQIEFRAIHLPVGKHIVTGDLVENHMYERESVKTTILTYEDLFQSEPIFYDTSEGIYAEAALLESVKIADTAPSVSADLKIAAWNESEYPYFIGAIETFVHDAMRTPVKTYTGDANSQGIFRFALDPGTPDCIRYELARHGSGLFGKYDGQICFRRNDVPKFPISWLYAVGMACILCIGTLSFIRHRGAKDKFRVLPPDHCHSKAHLIDSAQQIPELKDVPGDRCCAFICADMRTKAAIDASEITIVADGRTMPCRWPCTVTKRSDLHIKHRDYLSWHGQLRNNGRHVIYLTSRRDYVIECYDSVCKYVTDGYGWGDMTPEELSRQIEQLPGRFLTPGKCVRYRLFCKAISDMTYGKTFPDDTQLKKIYALSRELRSRTIHIRRQGRDIRITTPHR